MRRVYNVTDEPRGVLLRSLLRALARRATSILLIVRDDMELSEAGQILLAKLEPFLLERRRGTSWPGTVLVGGEGEGATLLRWKPEDTVVRELEGASEKLYGWIQPELPEDLAFLREDGSALLATIAHERDAYLEVTDDELQGLLDEVPGLSPILRTSPAS